MKRKWNWLDTVIVCVVLALIAGVVLFFMRPTGEEFANHTETDLYITVETEKARIGTFDAIKVGDAVALVNGKELGVIEKVEFLPSEVAVFDNENKQFSLNKVEEYPFCRVVIKTTGYKNVKGEVLVLDKAIYLDDEWNLETSTYRFVARITNVKGAE